MKSVRFDAVLQSMLKAAARMAGESESEFIRQAVAERSEQLLGDRLEERLGGLVGAIHSRGGRARDASKQYVGLLRRRPRQRSKPRS